MYVTTANECYALDAGSGRRLWHYQAARARRAWPATRPAASTAAWPWPATACSWSPTTPTSSPSTASRARCCGTPRWPTGARTTAPPRRRWPSGGLVVSGTSGGDEGIRGFVAAFDQATGKEVVALLDGAEARRAGLGDLARARTSTTRAPPPGSPAPTTPSSTRSTGRPAIPARTTTAASASATTSTPTRSWPSTPRRGRLKWHFQYTPHDVWDWDAAAAARARGRRLAGQAAQAPAARQPQRLLLRARPHERRAAPGEAVRQEADLGAGDRSGRPSGPQSRPGADSRRHEGLPGRGRRHQLVLHVLQSDHGPLLRADAREVHRSTREAPDEWQSGQSYYGGRHEAGAGRSRARRSCARSTSRPAPSPGSCRRPAPPESWGGTLATASGLVFFGEDSGALMAVDASTGAPLWHFQTNTPWKASPMTYVFDGKQHIAVAAGPNILAFALPPLARDIALSSRHHGAGTP